MMQTSLLHAFNFISMQIPQGCAAVQYGPAAWLLVTEINQDHFLEEA